MNRPGLVRRLAAMTYDTLLLAAVIMVAVAVTLPFSGGEAIADHPGLGRSLLQFWLLTVAFLFYGGFWTHGGQTLGMKAWRLRVTSHDGRPLRWRDAALRFAWAIPSIGLAGIGLWWMVFDPDRLALHDRLSRTALVRTG